MIVNHGFIRNKSSEIILGPLGWSVHGTFGTFVAAVLLVHLLPDLGFAQLPNHSIVSD